MKKMTDKRKERALDLVINMKINLECIFRISNLKNNFSRLFKLKIDLECWCG